MTNGESREKETESRFGSGHGYVTGRRRGRVTNDGDELRGAKKRKESTWKERRERKERNKDGEEASNGSPLFLIKKGL